MRAICLDANNGLTPGKEYHVVKKGSRPDSDRPWYDGWFLLVNDFGNKAWYDYNPHGIIRILAFTGDSIKYIGSEQNVSGLTVGKTYQTLDRKGGDEYFYFMNDQGKFVGINKVSYTGEPNFIEVTRIRGERLEVILER